MKQYKKAKTTTYSRRGKKRKITTVELTKRSKAIKTLEMEVKEQRTKNHPIPRGKSLKGKQSSWKRGGDFPANRPKPGWNWAKGRHYYNNDAIKIMHYEGEK